MSTAITQYESSTAISQWQEPEKVLADAKKAAVALKQIMDLKPNKVMFNNEQYLEREDWGTVARFYNCTAKSLETRFVQFGDVSGWEAVAVVIDMRTMNEIGRAESMCLSDEENWGDVPYYEWEDVLDENGKKIWDQNLRNGKGGYKAKKVQKGSKPKPLFQLRSMAQTRAEAKALKGVFSWVVVLAGYKPTPAEELTGHEDFDGGQGKQSKPPVTQPKRASEKQQTQPATQGQPQTEEKPGEKIISGIIEKATQVKSGTLWITVKGEPLAVAVDGDKIDGDMKEGNFIKFRALNKHNDKFISESNPKGQFWSLLGLMELSKVQEGEVSAAPDPNAKLDPENAALAEDLFGEKKAEGSAVIEDMKAKGQVTTAANLPATKPGTIGIKRGQRIWALINQNKANNNGFNEEEMKKILSALPVPLEHIRDLEMGMYEQVEKWATGQEDWHDFWKD